MMNEKMLQHIENYLAGKLSPEEARAFEQQLRREPFLARVVDLFLLGGGPLDQLLPHLVGLPRPSTTTEGGGPHPSRLWLLSLLTGTMLVGMNGVKKSPRKKKNAGQRKSDQEAHPGAG